MMKLILYDENKIVVDIIENIISPVIDGNNINWEGKSMNGINLPFLLIEDDIEIQESLTDEIILLDKKNEFTKVDLDKENYELKQRLEDAEMAIIVLMDSMPIA